MMSCKTSPVHPLPQKQHIITVTPIRPHSAQPVFLKVQQDAMDNDERASIMTGLSKTPEPRSIDDSAYTIQAPLPQCSSNQSMPQLKRPTLSVHSVGSYKHGDQPSNYVMPSPIQRSNNPLCNLKSPVATKSPHHQQRGRSQSIPHHPSSIKFIQNFQ
ncbi:hypothetical protein MIR68_006823 [Amoeboaphelidium protococcarum]|nr:hypothetical protein MIR68_006823 [Amoeboaphelidium protococcarum]